MDEFHAGDVGSGHQRFGVGSHTAAGMQRIDEPPTRDHGPSGPLVVASERQQTDGPGRGHGRVEGATLLSLAIDDSGQTERRTERLAEEDVVTADVWCLTLDQSHHRDGVEWDDRWPIDGGDEQTGSGARPSRRWRIQHRPDGVEDHRSSGVGLDPIERDESSDRGTDGGVGIEFVFGPRRALGSGAAQAIDDRGAPVGHG